MVIVDLAYQSNQIIEALVDEYNDAIEEIVCIFEKYGIEILNDKIILIDYEV